MVEEDIFWEMLINIPYNFSRPRVLVQIWNLDQTEGNFWKRNKHMDNFYKHPLWHQNGELAADVFWPAHEQSKGKHAGYEGQACPEFLWVGEEGKSFLASYQILQQRNDQFGWVRTCGGTNIVEIVHLSPSERRQVPTSSPPSRRKECNSP